MRQVKAGDRIGEYVLEREIGHGGFGVVFRARHNVFEDRFVAIKVADTDERAALLRREGLVQDLVKHPRAVEVLGLDPEHDPPYLVMELVEGVRFASGSRPTSASPPTTRSRSDVTCSRRWQRRTSRGSSTAT